LYPWDVFGLASYDAISKGSQAPNLSGVIPSNQCQESWHKMVKNVLRGNLRASTANVLEQRLPDVLRHDAILLPDLLCFEITRYNPRMLKKALRYCEDPKLDNYLHNVHFANKHKSKQPPLSYFILRFGNTKYDKITKKFARQYLRLLHGEEPGEYDDDAKPEDNEWLLLKHVMLMCSSVHWVTEVDNEHCYPCELNPANLVCTCKSNRSTTLCSHIIAVTAMCVPGTYTKAYIEALLEQLAAKGKKAPHRPRNALGGQHIQPEGDSDDGGEADEPEKDDEEGYSADEDDPGPQTEKKAAKRKSRVDVLLP
jgi:hypothetical protein